MKITFSLGILGFIALGSTAALAAAKVLPASACQALDESNLQLARGPTTIYAKYGGEFDIACPILRDNVTNTNGLTALQVRVTKGDSTSRSCTATSSDGFGGTLSSKVSSVSGTGLRTINWTTFNSSNSLSTYTVTCHFGANDVVQNLNWTEPNPSPAETADKKTISAISAKPEAMSDDLQRGAFGLWTDDLSNNTSLDIPILRDQFSGTKTLTSLSVRLNHSDPSVPTYCIAVISDNYMNPLIWTPPKYANVGDGTLTWTSAELNASFITGFYDVSCSIGSGDFIYGVSWGE